MKLSLFISQRNQFSRFIEKNLLKSPLHIFIFLGAGVRELCVALMGISRLLENI